MGSFQTDYRKSESMRILSDRELTLAARCADAHDSRTYAHAAKVPEPLGRAGDTPSPIALDAAADVFARRHQRSALTLDLKLARYPGSRRAAHSHVARRRTGRRG